MLLFSCVLSDTSEMLEVYKSTTTLEYSNNVTDNLTVIVTFVI